jgi:hypothetical protein
MISQEHELDSGLVQIETEKQAKGVRRDEMMMPPFFSAMNAIIKTEVAVNKVGIIKTPNHPM